MNDAGGPPQDRRRHARTAAAQVDVVLIVEGNARAAGLADDVVQDVSQGGLFVSCADPPRLGQRLVVRARAPDGRTAEVAARVVRVRWGGRRDGQAVPAGVALSFDDDGDARARLREVFGGAAADFSTRRPG